jgi:flavin reductase (DIM6/NTAB) family NADH-FMN oxidoreductase RutF
VRYDLDQVDTAIAYKLLAATVVPRPIAWVVTQDAQGSINAAPFSFFNVMGHNPPTVALGLLGDPVRGFKDTARNILDTGEFVINLVPMRLVEKMNLTAIDAPASINELEFADLHTSPSAHVKPPRIAESPVAFECVTHTAIETGPRQTIVIGRVLAVHIDDALVKDAARGHIHTEKLHLVGRMFGSGYTTTTDIFELVRPTWDARERM